MRKVLELCAPIFHPITLVSTCRTAAARSLPASYTCRTLLYDSRLPRLVRRTSLTPFLEKARVTSILQMSPSFSLRIRHPPPGKGSKVYVPSYACTEVDRLRAVHGVVDLPGTGNRTGEVDHLGGLFFRALFRYRRAPCEGLKVAVMTLLAGNYHKGKDLNAISRSVATPVWSRRRVQSEPFGGGCPSKIQLAVRTAQPQSSSRGSFAQKKTAREHVFGRYIAQHLLYKTVRSSAMFTSMNSIK